MIILVIQCGKSAQNQGCFYALYKEVLYIQIIPLEKN
jgi:hypothetical protein